MKTKEELRTLKEEVANVREKLSEPTGGELEEVIGGLNPIPGPHPKTHEYIPITKYFKCNNCRYEWSQQFDPILTPASKRFGICPECGTQTNV